jgi:hypothetical protein
MNDETQTDQTETDQTETDQTEGHDSAKEGNEADVPGLSLDPDDDNKSLEVDTNVRLDEKDKHRDDVPEDELEKEREERLDTENRPENTEVDNTQRTFDPETGLFEDSEIDPAEDAPFATTEAEESNTAEPKDREESTDAEQSKEDTESKDTES